MDPEIGSRRVSDLLALGMKSAPTSEPIFKTFVGQYPLVLNFLQVSNSNSAFFPFLACLKRMWQFLRYF